VYAVQISGALGVDAEFVVSSSVAALDLALRATRAGFDWSAQTAVDEEPLVALTLDVLRELAGWEAAAEPASATHLREVMDAERVAAAAGLN